MHGLQCPGCVCWPTLSRACGCFCTQSRVCACVLHTCVGCAYMCCVWNTCALLCMYSCATMRAVHMCCVLCICLYLFCVVYMHVALLCAVYELLYVSCVLCVCFVCIVGCQCVLYMCAEVCCVCGLRTHKQRRDACEAAKGSLGSGKRAPEAGAGEPSVRVEGVGPCWGSLTLSVSPLPAPGLLPPVECGTGRIPGSARPRGGHEGRPCGSFRFPSWRQLRLVL